MSKGEDTLEFQLKAYKMPFEREYHFHPTRKFRSDFAFPDNKLLVEIEGGQFVPGGGRHNRREGFAKDMEKYNEATRLGWRLMRFTPEQVKHGMAIITIRGELGLS